MQAVEFRTRIKNGIIQIPKKYTNEIGNTVKVIILSEQEYKDSDIVVDLLERPVKIDGFKPLSRDKIYERH